MGSTLGKWVPRSYAEGEECVARGEAEPLKGSMDDQARERLLRWRQDFGWPVGRDGAPGSAQVSRPALSWSRARAVRVTRLDASGKERLTYDRPTNLATELVAGTYTVVLNESRQRVEVPAGKQTVVRPALSWSRARAVRVTPSGTPAGRSGSPTIGPRTRSPSLSLGRTRLC